MAITSAASAAANTAARSVMTKLGAGSGVDTASLAQSLVDAEGTPKKAMLDKNIAKSESRISGYSAMLLNLDTIKKAFAALDDPSDVNVLSTTNSNPDAVTLTTAVGAKAGTQSIEVLALAKAQRTVSDGFAKADTQLNGGNEFFIRVTVNGTTKGIRVPAADTTPAGMAAAITNAKIGVTAQLMNTNDGSAAPYKIVLTGTEGLDNAFTVATDDGSGTSQKQNLSFGAATLSGNISVAGVAVAVTAGDSAIEVAAKVKVALDAEAFKTGSGRIYTDEGNGNLTVSYTYKDGDMPVVSFTDTDNTGVTQSVSTTTAFIQGSAISSVSEKQKLTLGEATADGNITVGGVTVTLAAGDSAIDVVAKVKAALESDASASGRVYTDNGDGTLSISYSAASGDVTDISFEDTDSTGVTSAVTTPTAYMSLPSVNFATNLEPATNAHLKINGLEVYRSGNSISDAIAGVTLNLNALTVKDTPAIVSLSTDTSALKTKVKALIQSFNDAMSDFTILTGPKNKSDDTDIYSGSLANDSTVQLIKGQLRAMFLGDSSTPGSNVKALRDLGVSITKTGTLELDEKKFDLTATNNFDEIVHALTADKENKSQFGTASRGIAGDAVKTIGDMMKATGVLASQTTSTQKQITRYKADLDKLEARMTALLARYTKTFAAMDAIVGQSSNTAARLKSQFAAMSKSNSDS